MYTLLLKVLMVLNLNTESTMNLVVQSTTRQEKKYGFRQFNLYSPYSYSLKWLHRPNYMMPPSPLNGQEKRP